jgi:hypothetical protein
MRFYIQEIVIIFYVIRSFIQFFWKTLIKTTKIFGCFLRPDLLIPIYVKLLTCVFDSGTWLSRNNIPIFKNKGISNDSQNYRPISISRCLRKYFTSILNKRLNACSDEFLSTDSNSSDKVVIIIFQKSFQII